MRSKQEKTRKNKKKQEKTRNYYRNFFIEFKSGKGRGSGNRRFPEKLKTFFINQPSITKAKMQLNIIICLLLLASVNAGSAARRRRRKRREYNEALAKITQMKCDIIDGVIFTRPQNTCPSDLASSYIEHYNKNTELIEFWKKKCAPVEIPPPSFSSIGMGVIILVLIALVFISICM